ncbi:MAG: glycosyltransferase [Roseburia sp.]
MRLDIVIAVAERGGVENVINMTSVFLKSRGWDVRIIQMVWEGIDWTPQEIPFFPLLLGRDGHNLAEFVEAYDDFLKKQGQPDIILAAAWPYMSYISKKVVCSEGKEIPVVSWLHAPVNRYQEAGFGGYDSLAYADAHMAISDSIYKAISARVSSKVFRVYNPVDFSRCAVEPIAIDDVGKKLFYIGRISPEKHIEVMLKALSLTSGEWRLYIIGDGEEDLLHFLQDEEKRLGLMNRVQWMGWQENPWIYAKQADAVVLASEYEGSPLTVTEAMACGKTVIATPVEGVKELIVPGKTGYLFDFGDSGMLAQILDMMSMDVLKPMMPEDCKEAVKSYEKNCALADFELKLKACFNAEVVDACKWE